MAENLRQELDSSAWFAPLNGGLPKVPRRAALPTANAQYAFRLVAVEGAPDVVYCCLRDDGGTYGWREVATGGAAP